MTPIFQKIKKYIKKILLSTQEFINQFFLLQFLGSFLQKNAAKLLFFTRHWSNTQGSIGQAQGII